MANHYITYVERADEQRSNFNTLSGALTPVVGTQYELPQKEYFPIGRVPAAGSMEPILFEDWNGSPWISLMDIRGNVTDLAHTMVGGLDLVFAQRTRPVKFELRIMWPGYDNQYSAGKCLGPRNTTRALLAQYIGQQMEIFIKYASGVAFAQNPYRVGPHGIQSGQILLGGLKNTYADTWQAIIYIDNTVHN